MNVGRVIAGCALAGGVAVFGAVHAFEDETTRDKAGNITTAGGLGAFVVRIGDCVQLPDTDLVASVEGVPCDAPHDAEAYAKFNVTDLTSFDLELVESRALEGCVERWHDAIGTVYEADTDLDVYAFTPSPLSWKAGDRGVVCFVISVDGSRSTGSRRSAR